MKMYLQSNSGDYEEEGTSSSTAQLGFVRCSALAHDFPIAPFEATVQHVLREKD